MIPRIFRRTFLHAPGLSLISLAISRAAVIQTNSQNNTSDNWYHTGAWGGSAPTSGNDYVTNASATGAFPATPTGLGTSVTSRIRNDDTSTFAGDSLKIVTGTELLVRTAGTTHTGNIIVENATVRSVHSTTLAGTLTTTTSGIIGLGSTNTLTINSDLTGDGTLYLRSSDGTPTIRFGGALLTAFSGFTGILEVGGGGAAPGVLTLDFDQDYVIPATLVMGTYSTPDILNLDQAVTVNHFKFGTTILAPDTYTADGLNDLFGNGSQFTGAGTLTVVIPEPGAALLGGLGSLILPRRRRTR